MRGVKCEKCGLTEWLGEPIHIEMHHIDGDRSNNTLENLQLLCPNCHSYTDNYGTKNKKIVFVSDEELVEALQKSKSIREALFSVGLSDAGANYTRARNLIRTCKISLLEQQPKVEKENFCVDCGRPIYPSARRCPECAGKQSRVCEHPSREELKQLIRTIPFTTIAKQFGVSDNAIRKWCDGYGLPRRSKDIKAISEEEWSSI